MKPDLPMHQSMMHTFTPATPPVLAVAGPPTNLVVSQITDTTAHLVWDSPAIGRRISGYTVTLSLAGGGGSVLADTTSNLQYDFTGLLPETDYTVVAVTVNPAGDSITSAAADFTTLPTP